MAVSMISPVSDNSMVTLSPGKSLGNQHRHNFRQIGVQRFSVPSFFSAFVIAFKLFPAIAVRSSSYRGLLDLVREH